MSSTTNIQNLLVNVFRPSYQYRALPVPNYFVELEISNVETVYANVIDSQNLRVADVNSNVYVGREAGNSYLELRDCFCNTTLGYGAGRLSSNTDRGIYIGFNAGTNSSNASNVIAIGTEASGRGTGNIYIGSNTGSTVDGESNNIYIGNDLSSSGGINNRLWIGNGLDPSGAIISGDTSTRSVGILTNNPTVYPIELADYTFIANGLGINANPQAHSLNVNGDCFIQDGYGQFGFDRDPITFDSTLQFWSYTASKAGLIQFGQTTTINPAFMGINTPAISNGYALDVSGTLRVRDLSGNTVTIENDIITSSNGYASIQGVTGSLANGATSNIGTWKRGITMVAVHSAAAGSWSGGSWIYDGTTATNISTNQANITITTSTSNIVLSNTSAGTTTFRYNITYFPTP
jgi:hypothetical protein